MEGEQEVALEPQESPVALQDDQAPLSELEQVAQTLGWKPKSEYAGPEEQWRPAAEFIRRGTNTRDLRRDLKRVTDQMDRMARTQGKVLDRALEQQKKELQAEFEEAVSNKDTAGAAKAVNKMQELQADNAPDDSSSTEADFAARNPWYGKDDEATAYAITVSQRLAKQGKSIDEQLEGVESAMKKRFPELYKAEEKPERKPLSVNTPSRGNGAARAQGFNDLPPHAKTACDNFADAAYARYGKGDDKEKFVAKFRKDYAKDYYQDQPA